METDVYAMYNLVLYAIAFVISRSTINWQEQNCTGPQNISVQVRPSRLHVFREIFGPFGQQLG
jgi:hypothetical protein